MIIGIEDLFHMPHFLLAAFPKTWEPVQNNVL